MLQVLQYAPNAPNSRGGTKLLCQSDFYLGSRVAKVTCARRTPPHTHLMFSGLFTGHDPTRRVGSGRVGSGRVGSGRVGSGRVGSGRVGSGGYKNSRRSSRVGSGGV